MSEGERGEREREEEGGEQVTNTAACILRPKPTAPHKR